MKIILFFTLFLFPRLNFSMEPIVTHYGEFLHYFIPLSSKSLESWGHFADTANKFPEGAKEKELPLSLRHTEQGALYFKNVFTCYSSSDKTSSQLWASLFSTSALDLGENNTLKETDYSKIEMCLTVSSEEDAPFVAHIGIFRNPLYCYQKKSLVDDYGMPIRTLPPNEKVELMNGKKFSLSLTSNIQHKNISVLLHHASIQCMKKIKPEKAYIVSSPTEVMRNILLKFLPQGTVSVGSNDSLPEFGFDNSTPDWQYNKKLKRRQLNRQFRTRAPQLSFIYKSCEGILATGVGCIDGVSYEPQQFIFSSPEGEILWQSKMDESSWWLVDAFNSGCEFMVIPFSAFETDDATS
jgi:hypothetical protein